MLLQQLQSRERSFGIVEKVNWLVNSKGLLRNLNMDWKEERAV